MPYMLFSQTHSTGRLQTLLMFRASWKNPMFVAPSPNMQIVTLSRLPYLSPNAIPAAIGRCAPTIACPPQKFFATSAMCIEPPLPCDVPGGLSQQLGHHLVRRDAAADRHSVIPVGRDDPVARTGVPRSARCRRPPVRCTGA